ncbi:Reverse transcriptase (RNA-dependent DNA polymerase) [Popillia japonica]|uniref:Reverse transcriptase (RNA-dependent DNA polymerase) n=1 Tax=Popillia japonica TaxID=7064 RepID=A0AAW1MJC7_POPJA
MRGPAPCTAGPDHLKLHHLRRMPVRCLVLMFNIMTVFGVVPRVLKANRTVLLHKCGDPHLVDSFRPITISSIVLRLFNRLLAQRLSRLPLHPHQRGFRKVDDRTIRLIGEQYREAFTKVSGPGNTTTGPIAVLKGAKQGDPLSPILFDMVLDELVCKLEEMDGGLFDMVLDELVCKLEEMDGGLTISESRETAQGCDGILPRAGISRLLRVATEFFRERGLALNAEKSAALSVGVVPGKKQLYTHTKNLFYVGGKAIPQLTPVDYFKYLGSRYNFSGQVRPSVELLKTQLARVQSAPYNFSGQVRPSVELLKTQLARVQSAPLKPELFRTISSAKTRSKTNNDPRPCSSQIPELPSVGSGHPESPEGRRSSGAPVARFLSCLQSVRVTLKALKDADRLVRLSGQIPELPSVGSGHPESPEGRRSSGAPIRQKGAAPK